MLTRKLTRRITQALTRKATEPGNGGGWSPLSLFASGEQGVWYDPSDFSTMFQDSAGTTPVTAVGQPVGKILDKSGRGNHASQSTAAARPVLLQDKNNKYYLAFDGEDDFLATASINFTSTDKMTVVAGVRKENDATSIVAELSDDANGYAGSFYFATGHDLGLIGYTSSGRGSASITSALCAKMATFSGTDLAVISVTHDIAGDLSTIRRNGVAGTDGTGDKGAGNFGNYPLYIGCRGFGSLVFAGSIYGLIVRGAATDAAGVSNSEAYMAGKTGVTL